MATRLKRFIDIGANLTDPQFRGIYRGTRKHPDDLAAVLSRAKEAGVVKILVTGSNLEESREALELCRQNPGFLFSTVGVHPCHAADVPEEGTPEFAAYFGELEQMARTGAAEGHVKAFGEIGLDHDRLHFAPADRQRSVFGAQLEIATRVGLPLFLHSRNAEADFHTMIEPYVSRLRGGVVHSFTGNARELADLLKLNLYIGVNGCSLKTHENLDVLKKIPLDRIMLETDGPWCEIRRTHASHQYTSPLPFESANKPEKWAEGRMVRGRCEPCAIGSVAEVVAAVHGVDVEVVMDRALDNTMRLFSF